MGAQILVIIQVRLNSKRLTGKALLPLGEVPMLVYLLRRLKVLPRPYKLIVATTTNAEDDNIAFTAEKEGIEVVRGEEQDVLARYIKCIAIFPAELIVRVTADNPLTDPEILMNVTSQMRKKGYDYVRAMNGYPVGAGVDAFTDKLLRLLYKNTTSAYDREHLNSYVLSHPDKFKICELHAPCALAYPDLRLTVDTSEDYERLKKIVESYPRNYFINTEDAIECAYKRNI